MTHLAAIDPVQAALLLSIAAIAGLLRALIVHRTAVRREEEHTHRIRIIVEGSMPVHRAAVVRAGAELEAASWLPSEATRRRSRRARDR
ncbi:hypothetical protein AABB02_05485 [Streptomyces rimosus]|uniref:hypothetical protein n=1 Tax=Streptomyces rimosus TaxID=1927 RepID=UPI0031D028A7